MFKKQIFKNLLSTLLFGGIYSQISIEELMVEDIKEKIPGNSALGIGGRFIHLGHIVPTFRML